MPRSLGAFWQLSNWADRGGLWILQVLVVIWMYVWLSHFFVISLNSRGRLWTLKEVSPDDYKFKTASFILQYAGFSFTAIHFEAACDPPSAPPPYFAYEPTASIECCIMNDPPVQM